MTMIDDREATDLWVEVCAIEDLVPGRGVCALVRGWQIAIFLLPGGAVHAVDNHDPCSGANVLSRGITGTIAGTPTVASPIYKQRFDLRTGVCLDDESVRIGTHGVRIEGDRVVVRCDRRTS